MRREMRSSLLGIVLGLALVCAAPTFAAARAARSSAEDPVRVCMTKQFGEKKIEAFLAGAPYDGSDLPKFKACGFSGPQAMALFKKIGPQGQGQNGGQGQQGGSQGPQGGPSQSGSFSDQMSNGQCQGKGGKLTAPVVDASKLAYIYPYGGMIGAHITPVDHTYFYDPQSSNESVAAGSYLVTSPADGAIVQVGKLDSDYRLVLEVSCDVYVILIHVQELKGPLAKFNSLPRGGSGSGRFPVKAGEVIADDSGAPGFDFSVHDARVNLKGLLNPAAYATTENWKIHTVDPANYWTPAIWATYAAKSLRTAAPRAGKLDYDVAGTASGNWFVQGTHGYQGLQTQPKLVKPGDQRGYWDTHLALAPDPVDPSAIVVSVGDYDGCACQFAVIGNTPLPVKVTAASGIVVYALGQRGLFDPKTGQGVDPRNPPAGYKVRAGGTVLGLLAIRVNKDGTLTVEKLPGVTDPKSFTGFGANAKTYER